MWTHLECERVESEIAGLVIYRLRGALSYGKDADAVVSRIRADCEAGVKQVALNLAQVDRIDSGGIGLLSATCASVQNAGGRIQLVGLPQRYRKLFKVVGISSLFQLVDSEDDLTAADA